MCAAPGSKTAQIIEMLHEGIDEGIPGRLQELTDSPVVLTNCPRFVKTFFWLLSTLWSTSTAFNKVNLLQSRMVSCLLGVTICQSM